MTPDEETLLFRKYDLKHDGTICYRDFCDVINRSTLFSSPLASLDLSRSFVRSEYPETTITANPENFTNAAPPYLNSWRSTRHIGTQDESERLKEVLQRIGTYCKQRGIDVLTTMEQYDRHQMGEITDSQFYRAFVGPKLSEAEMTLLRDKYSDPGKPGLMNYLNFVQDLNASTTTTNNDTASAFQDHQQQSAFSNPFIGVEEKVNEDDSILSFFL